MLDEITGAKAFLGEPAYASWKRYKRANWMQIGEIKTYAIVVPKRLNQAIRTIVSRLPIEPTSKYDLCSATSLSAGPMNLLLNKFGRAGIRIYCQPSTAINEEILRIYDEHKSEWTYEKHRRMDEYQDVIEILDNAEIKKEHRIAILDWMVAIELVKQRTDFKI